MEVALRACDRCRSPRKLIILVMTLKYDEGGSAAADRTAEPCPRCLKRLYRFIDRGFEAKKDDT